MNDNNKFFLELFYAIDNYKKLAICDYKYSYLIVKPNGNRHLDTFMKELEKQKFRIVKCFAIRDFETINVALHNTEREKRHIIPINKMFCDFYGNYAILIVVSKRNITYENFVIDVQNFKTTVRRIFEYDYISYVFEASKILGYNEGERLIVLNKNNQIVEQKEMNHEGTYMVFSINSIHSPEPNIDITIQEFKLLRSLKIFTSDNVIPDTIVKSMRRYNSFSFLKDL